MMRVVLVDMLLMNMGSQIKHLKKLFGSNWN
jgi:hypothetical protein